MAFQPLPPNGLRVTPHREVPAHRVASLQKAIQLNMKKILILTGTITLLATTGCLVHDHGYNHDGGHYRQRGHYEHYEHHSAVIVSPPVLEVHPPVIIVH